MARPNKVEEKKAKLIQVAEVCFSRYGFTKTTLDDVARACELNKSSLYHYFKNKEDLFLAISIKVAKESMDEVIRLANLASSSQERINRFFDFRLDKYINFLRLNTIDKHDLLRIQSRFNALYLAEAEEEFLYSNFKAIGADENWILTVLPILVQTIDAVKHSGVFLGNLLELNSEELASTRKKISFIVEQFINNIK